MNSIAMRASVLASLLLATGVVNAQSGELWQVTMQVSMPGVPAGAMQPTKLNQCLPKNRGSNPYAMQPAGKREDCKATDEVKTSNGSTWKIVCDDGTTGTGKIVYTSTDSWEMESQMSVQGQQMVTKGSGKRIGTCDLPPAKK